jgi:hypothetical protein
MTQPFYKYPSQQYFKFHGPWMSSGTYYFNVAICLVILAVFFLLYKTKKLFLCSIENNGIIG